MTDEGILGLVHRVANGEGMALDELYDRTSRRLYSIAFSIVGNREAAEDVLQEVYLSVVQNAHRFRGDKVDAWLARISRNKALDYLRSNRRFVSQDDFPLLSVEDFSQFTAEKLDLQTKLNALSPSDRDLLFMRFYCDMTIRDIAQETGEARMKIHRRIERLLAELK